MAKVSFHIDGMDCPSCVSKIEGAVGSLPGACDVTVNRLAQRMDVELDQSNGSTEAVEKIVKGLGFDIRSAEKPRRKSKPFWRERRAQIVFAIGAMLAVAFGLSFLYPALSGYLFAATALLGMLPFVRSAANSISAGRPFTIETLMVLAVIGAIFIGEAAEAAMVVFLFSIGELLEKLAAYHARKEVQALADLAPRNAFIIIADKVSEVAADQLRPGDLIEVRPGGHVPADGTVISGESYIDTSAITGESKPVAVKVGDDIFAGSINADDVLRLRVERTGADNMIGRILKLVEEAENAKAPTQRFIDRFATYYMPFVILVAGLTILVPPMLFGAEWLPWIYKGLALLLIGCPCALVLSTPAAITSGIAAGARQGLLMKGGVVLEAIGAVRTVAFDKTGTLSKGRAGVSNIEIFGDIKEDELLALTAAIETASSHPLAAAIVQEAKARGLDIPAARDGKAMRGRGVLGFVDDKRIIAGSPRYAREQVKLGREVESAMAELEGEGKSIVVVLREKELLGILALRDELREDAADAIGELTGLGVTSLMLSGDNKRTAQTLASRLGMEVRAELLPEDKLRAIEELQGQGTVAMVGDGINDAPALARADIGIAMGGGTDVALETADAAILKERVRDIPAMIRLSRTTLSNIHQNIAIALGLKAVFLVTTLLGLTSLWMAILADTGATLIVTLNALRLLRFKA